MGFWSRRVDFLEDIMMIGRSTHTRCFVFACILAVVMLFLFPLSSSAQTDEPVPKWDLFAGYQWLHTGITTPAGFGDPNNPTPFEVPDMPKGFGAALTYNLDSHWGMELDFGQNWGNGSYNTTISG